MRNALITALSAGLLLSFAACSSNGNTGTGAGASTGVTTGTSMGSCPENLAAPSGSEFCAADKTAIDCTLVTPAYANEVCGVPVQTPKTALTRSDKVKEFNGSGPPDLSCFQPANYPTG